MNDFLFHKVSDKEKEDIRKQAKQIMDNFVAKLSELDDNVAESFIEREKCDREEGGECAEINREIMFENAPNKNQDFIIAEKKKW